MRLVMADNIGEDHGPRKLIFRGVRHKKPFCHHGASGPAPCHGYQKMRLVMADNIDSGFGARKWIQKVINLKKHDFGAVLDRDGPDRRIRTSSAPISTLLENICDRMQKTASLKTIGNMVNFEPRRYGRTDGHHFLASTASGVHFSVHSVVPFWIGIDHTYISVPPCWGFGCTSKAPEWKNWKKAKSENNKLPLCGSLIVDAI